MATLYYAEHVHIAQTLTWIPTPYFCVGQEYYNSMPISESISGNVDEPLGFIYIRAKANAKATSLPTCCIVSDLCIYTTATAVAANIKEKNRFRVRFRSNINEPLRTIMYYNTSGPIYTDRQRQCCDVASDITD